MSSSEDAPWYWTKVERLIEEGCTADEISGKVPVSERILFSKLYERGIGVTDAAIDDSKWKNKELMEELYVEENYSIEEIADRFDCNESTIQEWLNAFGLKRQRPDEIEKPWRDERKLRELYVEKDLEPTEIAQKFDVTHATIYKWIDRYNIEKEKKVPPWQNEDRLRELYTEKELGVKEIGNKLGCHHETVRTWLIRHDIERRGKEEGPWQNKDVLVEKYLNEKKSTVQIGEELGCHPSTVSYWLARHGINTRGTESTHRKFNQDTEDKPEYQKREILESLYIEKEKSIEEISKELDCTPHTLVKHLDRHDLLDSESEVEYRDTADIDSVFELECVTEDSIKDLRSAELYRNEELLEHLYIDVDIGATKIANLLRTSPTTVLDWLHEYNIIEPESTRGGADLDEEWLREKYIDEKKSIWEISKEVKHTQSEIGHRLKELDIDLRDNSESYVHEWLKDGEKLKELYIDDELSAMQIGIKLNSSTHTVIKWLDRHDIEMRPRREEIQGPKNPHWKGGIEPYGEGWTQEKKEKVLERDNYRCQSCGIENSEHRQKFDSNLHIHHIIPARKFEDASERNSADNLVALCAQCHKDWEGIPVKPTLYQDGQ